MAIARSFVAPLNRSLSRLVANPSSGHPDAHVAGLDLFESLGGNCLYLHGEGGETHSREATGRWLSVPGRSEFFLATQICHDDWDDATATPIIRFTEQAVAEDVTKNLELLAIDHIDLVCLGDQPTLPLEPIIDALARQIEGGRIGQYGLCSWSASRIRHAIAYARQRDVPTPAAALTTELALPRATGPLWPEYPPFDQELENVVCDNSLAGLAHVEDFNLGQCLFDEDGVRRPWRPNWIARWNHPSNAALVARTQAFASSRGLTPREVNLSYILSLPFSVLGIISLPALLG
jgi:aryl-alcohol dehydrogenase-like predicted oxidoreductase